MAYEVLWHLVRMLSVAGVGMAYPRNDFWHTAAWGDARTVRGEAGGIYGVGGQSDFGI